MGLDKLHPIQKKIMRLAGIHAPSRTLTDTDIHFETIMAGLAMVHHAKDKQYGNYIKNNADSPLVFAIITHFSDVKRKYVRAEQQTKNFAHGRQPDDQSLSDMVDAIMETYADLAVYCVMGIQLLERLEQQILREEANE